MTATAERASVSARGESVTMTAGEFLLRRIQKAGRGGVTGVA